MTLESLKALVLGAALFASPAWAENLALDSAVRASNDFGWSVFQKLQSQEAKTNRNVLFSPLSAWLALSLTSNGAEAETLEEMQKTLRTEAYGLTETNQGVQGLMNRLLTDSASSEVVRIANAVWVNSDMFELSAKFQADAQTFYSILPDQEVVRSASFQEAGTLEAINAWVQKNTGGMIPSIINKLDPNMANILLSALYFQGQWQVPFTQAFTEEGSFHVADGSTRRVRMMKDSARRVPLASTDQYKMMSLGFRQTGENASSGAYVLDLILPSKAEGSVFQLQQSDYEKLLQRAAGVHARVAIPRFKFAYEQSLQDELSALGMRRVFIPGAAQLGPLGTPKMGDAFVSAVLQKTAIEMDENGLKAAAVTGVIVGTTSAPVVTASFIADRPFFLALRNRETGAILFQGIVSDPTRS